MKTKIKHKLSLLNDQEETVLTLNRSLLEIDGK
mgnify:CR=1 FL=1